MTPPRLTAPVSALPGVGPNISEKLRRLGIDKLRDLLFHLPGRYIDRTQISLIGELEAGREALIQGQIELTQIQYGRRRSLLCRISDGTGALTLRFFHFSRAQQENLARGHYLRCWGQARRGAATLEMIHPEYQLVGEQDLDNLEQTLTPVYPSTEGITQARLRKLTGQALAALDRGGELEELLPPSLLNAGSLPSLTEALKTIHRPPPDTEPEQLLQGRHPAQQRLIIEELLAHHLSLRSIRHQIRHYHALPVAPDNHQLTDRFIKALPFQLTAAQQRVLEDINTDLAASVPMLRLIQGDVGSGKTVVAAIAAIRTINAGSQVALMAPTELLADQHYYNLQQWFGAFDIPVRRLTGKLKASERNLSHQQLAEGKPLIAVGTHALFQESVRFGNLGLIIIDEQHRFGVHQRLALIEKGGSGDFHPHQLIMTATPIPRTLAMTLFAELDISVIDELPPGRQPVTTAVLSNQKRDELIERIASACREGHQVYWVCTLIDESETLQCQTAINTRDYLHEILPELRIDLIHGQMKGADKERIMQEFKAGDIQVLVATTVIEVGVDVPNASLMVIENAERLGLSQLHQLRGRVGRGTEKSNCILLYQPPLTETARARLEVMRSTSDGFIIAEKDLAIRGPGDMLGTRQTGLPEMRVADLVRDAKLLPRIQKMADTILEQYPEQVDALTTRWLSTRLDFGKV
ncbi:MAG: ATP-dependent DNA helicase RecG [Gammaproteobacteria bacterium]